MPSSQQSTAKIILEDNNIKETDKMLSQLSTLKSASGIFLNKGPDYLKVTTSQHLVPKDGQKL